MRNTATLEQLVSHSPLKNWITNVFLHENDTKLFLCFTCKPHTVANIKFSPINVPQQFADINISKNCHNTTAAKIYTCCEMNSEKSKAFNLVFFPRLINFLSNRKAGLNSLPFINATMKPKLEE